MTVEGSCEDIDYAAPVVDTLIQSGLELNDCVVIGGAALALNCIRPAGDLDLVLNPFVFDEIANAGQTPGGLAVKAMKWRDNRLIGETPEGPITALALDLNTFDGKRRIFTFSDFKKRANQQDSSHGEIYCATLDDILAIKARSWSLKGRRDARRIRQYLKVG
ncbi:hypothetical protein KY385_00950 [Candidatus Parcubacteria bacterium]|nr:hypothetical protein [Candidatus Parcubacteria bacterium]